jgi:hypothetical protein
MGSAWEATVTLNLGFSPWVTEDHDELERQFVVVTNAL